MRAVWLGTSVLLALLGYGCGAFDGVPDADQGEDASAADADADASAGSDAKSADAAGSEAGVPDASSTPCDGGECGDRLIFVTSKLYPGDVGGVGGGDAKCMEAATSAGTLAPGRAFKAWLSTDTLNAKDRIAPGARYLRTDHQLVAPSFADLLGATINGSKKLLAPIDKDEMGQPVGSGAFVWTGTTATGESVAGQHCASWSLDMPSVSARVGLASATEARWSDSQSRLCNTSARLYCIEIEP